MNSGTLRRWISITHKVQTNVNSPTKYRWRIDEYGSVCLVRNTYNLVDENIVYSRFKNWKLKHFFVIVYLTPILKIFLKFGQFKIRMSYGRMTSEFAT